MILGVVDIIPEDIATIKHTLTEVRIFPRLGKFKRGAAPLFDILPSPLKARGLRGEVDKKRP